MFVSPYSGAAQQHSVGGATLDNDHIEPTYPYHHHRRTRVLQHLAHFK